MNNYNKNNKFLCAICVLLLAFLNSDISFADTDHSGGWKGIVIINNFTDTLKFRTSPQYKRAFYGFHSFQLPPQGAYQIIYVRYGKTGYIEGDAGSHYSDVFFNIAVDRSGKSEIHGCVAGKDIAFSWDAAVNNAVYICTPKYYRAHEESCKKF